MASRVAGCATASTPDYLGEVMELVTQCRTDIAAVADGWIEGRLTEEAYKAMSASLLERARMVADILRLSKKEMDSVLSRTTVKKIMPARGSAGEPERTR